jgi:hypothetical protein
MIAGVPRPAVDERFGVMDIFQQMIMFGCQQIG